MEPSHTQIPNRSFGWQEIAILYCPGIAPRSAVKRLARWVNINRKLQDELIEHGWYKGVKTLTPIQVKLLVHYLGEPDWPEKT